VSPIVTSKPKNIRQHTTPTEKEMTEENAPPPYRFKVALQPNALLIFKSFDGQRERECFYLLERQWKYQPRSIKIQKIWGYQE
jgi:hypothetical protein